MASTPNLSPGNSDRHGIVYRGLLRRAARAPDSFGLLLFLLLVDYVILSVDWRGYWALIVSTTFIGLTALLAAHTSGVRGTPYRWIVTMAGIALLSSVAAAISDADRAKGVAFIFMAILILVCPIVVVSRIMRHSRVTAETLLGAICVYVLIGLMFAYIDLAFQYVSGSPYFAQSGHHGSPDFVYFSFITMTTVGYGDLTPATGLPRTSAVLEALSGQVFLVVLVSRLVAMYQPMSSAARRAFTVARLEGKEAASPGEADAPEELAHGMPTAAEGGVAPETGGPEAAG